MTEQYDFDQMIGQLDHVLSMMIACSKEVRSYREVATTTFFVIDKYNQQTLKHHAEDMILAGKKILENLEKELNS